ncbi:MAG: hypothetical protein ABSA02_36095 [Trebonia sp.]
MATSLQEALDQVLSAEGVRTVALIDIASGMVVRFAGEPAPRFATAAASLADEARAARHLLGPRPGGELEEITTVTASGLQLSKILLDKPGDGFLLFVDLDRARANIALASLRVGQLASAVLA